jgi:hypothetical protein
MGEFTEAVLTKLPSVVVVGGSLLSGLYWIINRRMTLAEERRAGGAGRFAGEEARR